MTGLEKQMGMITEKRPGVARGRGVRKYLSHAFDKEVPVEIITEDQSSFDTADDNMVQNTFGIKAGMTRHRTLWLRVERASRAIYLFTVVPYIPLFISST
jgi:hypothetical protein